MSGLMCVDSGDLNLAKQAFGLTTTPAHYHYHYYTNNKAPAKGDTISSYTELSGTLYTPAAVLTSSLSVATVSHVTTVTGANLTIAILGTCTIYGYFVTDDTDSVLYWAEQWVDGSNNPLPLTFGSGGGTITQPVALQFN